MQQSIIDVLRANLETVTAAKIEKHRPADPVKHGDNIVSTTVSDTLLRYYALFCECHEEALAIRKEHDALHAKMASRIQERFEANEIDHDTLIDYNLASDDHDKMLNELAPEHAGRHNEVIVRQASAHYRSQLARSLVMAQARLEFPELVGKDAIVFRKDGIGWRKVKTGPSQELSDLFGGVILSLMR